MSLTEELPIYRATYRLLNMLIRATQEFPRFYKYSLGTRMVDICLDMSMLLYLLRETIFNCPEKNCLLRCPVSHWKGLPRDKSLFHSDGKHGLPIGNLTSQKENMVNNLVVGVSSSPLERG